MLHCYLNDCIIYIDAILHENADDVDIAIKLCLYCMRTQIFNDGNKRASVIIANHFMITKGQVLLEIPSELCFRIYAFAGSLLRRPRQWRDYGIYAELLLADILTPQFRSTLWTKQET